MINNFAGYWTLEIFNISPIPFLLMPNMRIGQISFSEVVEPLLYEGSYNDQYDLWPRPPKHGGKDCYLPKTMREEK